MKVLRSIRGKLLKFVAPVLSDRQFIKLMFYHRVGYWCNLQTPQTFCEKIQWLKLNNQRPDFTKLVDKVDSKGFVERIVGKEYIIPTLGVWDHFDDIDFSKLPDGFILKCAHDSSKGVVVKDKTQIDITSLKKRMEHFQKRSYFMHNREYPYKDVPHRLIAEQFMVNGTDNELKDYKFFCFNGKAEYCQLIADRTTDETIDFYDRSWNHQEFIGLNPNVHQALVSEIKPVNYQEMLEVADKLATAINHPFVRIDLYNVNGKVYFGEITFFPAGGYGTFRPKVWDSKLGQMINLEKSL